MMGLVVFYDSFGLIVIIFLKKVKEKPLESGLFAYLAGVAGLEPTLTVLETVALPIELYPCVC